MPALAVLVAAVLVSCGDDDDGAPTGTPVTTVGSPAVVGGSAATPFADGSDAAPSGYVAVSPTPLPSGHTAEVSDPPDDGIYWATVGSSDDEGITFNLVQAYFGDDCVAHFGTMPESCLDDYGIDDSTTAIVTMRLDTDDVTVLSAGDTTPAYRITGAELARLVAGQPPSADAPAGYAFSFFPFLVTVTDATVSAAHQVFTP